MLESRHRFGSRLRRLAVPNLVLDRADVVAIELQIEPLVEPALCVPALRGPFLGQGFRCWLSPHLHPHRTLRISDRQWNSGCSTAGPTAAIENPQRT